MPDEHGSKIGILRCRIDAAAAGAVQLKLNSPDGLSLWLDGRPIHASDPWQVDLTAGQHALVIEVLLDQRQEPIRLELCEVKGSAARAQFASGR